MVLTRLLVIILPQEIINSDTVNSSLIVLDPYANIPNLAYSDFNAVINNALIPRQSNIFWDLDYSY